MGSITALSACAVGAPRHGIAALIRPRGRRGHVVGMDTIEFYMTALLRYSHLTSTRAQAARIASVWRVNWDLGQPEQSRRFRSVSLKLDGFGCWLVYGPLGSEEA